MSAKACIATGIAGLGAAGIAAGALAFAAADQGAPRTAPQPLGISGPSIAGGLPGSVFSGDPAAFSIADPPISLDPASLGDPSSWADPGAALSSDDPDPEGPPDPRGPGDPPDPRDPPARVPEPSSAALLMAAVVGTALWRLGVSFSMAPDPAAARRRE